MKLLNLIFIGCCLFVSNNCTSGKDLFEKSKWWTGHWVNVSDTSYFFSIGSIHIGDNEINTPQFFFSTRDTILSNFFMTNLIDFDYKENWKLMNTSEDTYLKIREMDDDHIEVFGPVKNPEDLTGIDQFYERLSDYATPPFSDSILHDIK